MAEGAAPGRLHAVDHIKAAAIVAVIATHAGRGSFDPSANPLDFALTTLWTRFQVPSFLFVSGLLFARSFPVDSSHVWERLKRILLPYLVASGVALLAGVAQVRGIGEVAFALATGSVLGVYYYIFIAALCIAAIWPLSRLWRTGVLAAWLACLGFTLAMVVEPGLRPSPNLFWSLRDPLEQFMLGWFLTGWLVASRIPEISRIYARHRALVLCAATAATLGGMLLLARLLPFSFGALDRVLYTAGVIVLLAAATHARPPGPVVRFLSEATLGLYLFHRIFQLLAQPWTHDWPDVARIAGRVAVGLGGASLLILAGRALLGRERARRLLGG